MRLQPHRGARQCDGIDASAEQGRAGLAWVFDRYVKDGTLYALQDEARAAGWGPWCDAETVAPWEWRDTKLRKNRPARRSSHDLATRSRDRNS